MPASPPMLTPEDIQLAKINIDVAREAHAQASKMLEDALATKSGYDAKSSNLFTGYIAVSLALASGAALAFSSQDLRFFAFHLMIDAVIFAAGSICFVLSLIGMKYGSLGSPPTTWLIHGIIDGDESALARTLTHVTYHHAARIDQCRKSNRAKDEATRIGICLGVIAPVHLFIVTLFFIY